MQELTLQAESRRDSNAGSSKPGSIPWAVAVLSALALAYLLNQQLQRIHADVTSGVRAVMATSNIGNQVEVGIDGRDVTFSGTVSSKADRDWFVESVGKLEPVRVARDDMVELDPRQRSRLQRQKFQQSIRDINVSAIAFEPNSSDFTPASEGALQKMADLLLAHPQRRIKVAGHTDSSGRRDRNLELSRLRARAVSDYLQSRGVPDVQLISQGYGSTQPIDTNETEAGRATNRRIEITVMN